MELEPEPNEEETFLSNIPRTHPPSPNRFIPQYSCDLYNEPQSESESEEELFSTENSIMNRDIRQAFARSSENSEDDQSTNCQCIQCRLDARVYIPNSAERRRLFVAVYSVGQGGTHFDDDYSDPGDGDEDNDAQDINNHPEIIDIMSIEMFILTHSIWELIAMTDEDQFPETHLEFDA